MLLLKSGRGFFRPPESFSHLAVFRLGYSLRRGLFFGRALVLYGLLDFGSFPSSSGSNLDFSDGSAHTYGNGLDLVTNNRYRGWVQGPARPLAREPSWPAARAALITALRHVTGSPRNRSAATHSSASSASGKFFDQNTYRTMILL